MLRLFASVLLLSLAFAATPEDVEALPTQACPTGCYRRPGLCPIACKATRTCRFKGRNRAGKQRFGFKCVPYVDKPCPFRCAPYPACRTRSLGKTTAAADGAETSCRFGTCGLGNLLADAMLDRGRALGASLAFVNGGSIRASLPRGKVSFADLEEMLPFGNSVVVVTLSGGTIVRALENGLRVGAGRFPQIAGMVVKADLELPQGERVRGVTVGGEPLLADRLYRMVTSSFIAGGGDGYVWDGATVVESNSCATKAVLQRYITSKSPVTPDNEPRIINTAVMFEE